jgi:hypothetical protein
MRNSPIMQKPLTPSLSPSNGERVAEGRVRGWLGQSTVLIGDWPITSPFLSGQGETVR